jgi:hypothetical protein
MDKNEVNQAQAFLHQPRPCRVCGTTFRPERWDALVCSSTCKARRLRGQDLTYLAGLGLAAAKEHEMRHKEVAASIARLKAHFAAERKRREDRKADEKLREQWEAAQIMTENEFLKRPASTREAITEAVLAIMGPKYQFFITIAADRLLLTREFGRRWVFEHPSDSRESLIEAVRMLGLRYIRMVAEVIVDEALKCRAQVTKAFNSLLSDGQLRTPDQIQAAISKALPHIPPEAIATILKQQPD